MNNIHEKAVKNIGVKNTIEIDTINIKLAFIIREQDTRPLQVPWWKGKEVYLIAGDINGNFFLRHCDGSVRYWEHTSKTDKTVAKSVKEFFQKIN